MKYLHPVTPSDPRSILVKTIKERVGLTAEPEYVDVAVVESARVDDCFPNVAAQVAANAGQQILGWTLWEFPGLYFEAEFHAVWQRPDGKLVDITPKREPTTRILFIRDPSASYEGLQVNNVRVATSSESAVREFLNACDQEFDFMNSDGRGTEYGEIALSGDDAVKFHLIQQTKAEAMFGFMHLPAEIGPYTPCPCGCGKKTKWCDEGRAA